MTLDAKLLRPCHQALAIALAFAADKSWMRGAQHHVDRIGLPVQDRRHCIDHDFDALVWRKQAEGKNDRLAGEPEPGFRRVRFGELSVGNAVRDDLDLP